MNSGSGQQFSVSHVSANANWTATIDTLGATLRQMSCNGVELIQTWQGQGPGPFCAGIVLSPWGNRLANGQWQHNGQTLQVPINEPSKNNANHGLLISRVYEVVRHASDSITLATTIEAPEGYPFVVDTTVTYQLTEGGLVVTHTATNRSAEPAPYAVGAHPYFTIAGTDTGDLVLQSGAQTVSTYDEQQIPTDAMPVDGTRFDLRAGQPVRASVIDHHYFDLPRDENGLAHTYLSGNGASIDIWQDATFTDLVIFTPDFYPTPDGLIHAVAVEPMTAPPNALNSKQRLRWLQAGETFEAQWGVKFNAKT